jgi:hypothetical protein
VAIYLHSDLINPKTNSAGRIDLLTKRLKQQDLAKSQHWLKRIMTSAADTLMRKLLINYYKHDYLFLKEKYMQEGQALWKMLMPFEPITSNIKWIDHFCLTSAGKLAVLAYFYY